MRVIAAAECMIAIDSSRPTGTAGNLINPLLHFIAHDGYPGQVILVRNRNFFTARLGNVFRAVTTGLSRRTIMRSISGPAPGLPREAPRSSAHSTDTQTVGRTTPRKTGLIEVIEDVGTDTGEMSLRL